jgi:branched-chain amino acid transport system substrate-binding protein
MVRLEFLAVWVALLGAGAPAWASAADAALIKLGFAAPLSGPQAHHGRDMRSGLELAIEEANLQGIRLDGKTAKFVLVVRDDRADPHRAVRVARQLVSAGVKGVLGHFNSGASIAASRIYHDAGLPQIAMATAPQYTRQGYETAYRMMTSDTQQGTAVGVFIVKDLGVKRIALIDDRGAYGQGLADEVAKAVQATGGEVIARHYTDDTANDFTTILRAIKSQTPGAIFFGGGDAQAGLLRRQMVSMGIEARFISGDMALSDAFLKLAGAAANGAYASLVGVPVQTMDGGKRFLQSYEQRFKAAPGVYAPYAYDGAWNMITAMQQAGSSDPAKYLPKLAGLKRSGATSRHISYDRRGDLKETADTLYEVRNDQWVMVKTLVSLAAE